MLTIRFGEEDRYHSAPYFCLLTPEGRQVSLGDFYERSNLVLVFVPESCQSCPQFLQQLASRSQEFARENARLLAVFSPGSNRMPDLQEAIGGQIMLLEGPSQAVRTEYISLMAPGLVGNHDLLCFVLDTYGAPYACLAGPQPEPADQAELLSWLHFIGIQCPE